MTITKSWQKLPVSTPPVKENLVAGREHHVTPVADRGHHVTLRIVSLKRRETVGDPSRVARLHPMPLDSPTSNSDRERYPGAVERLGFGGLASQSG